MSDVKTARNLWNRGYRAVITCGKCGTVAWSKYLGQFATCDCGEAAVDQTLYYCRYIGEISKSEHRIVEKVTEETARSPDHMEDENGD